VKTIGIDEVARFAASAVSVPAAKMTSTLSATSADAAASAPSFCANRRSIARLRPIA
jgi:hypothetical protein